MYYINKVTKMLVNAKKYDRDDPKVEILTENHLVTKSIKETQWLVMILDSDKNVKDVIILEDQIFNSTFEPFKQILHG